MDLLELQTKTDEIIKLIDKKLGVEHNDNNTVIHILEELGEIAR